MTSRSIKKKWGFSGRVKPSFTFPFLFYSIPIKKRREERREEKRRKEKEKAAKVIL